MFSTEARRLVLSIAVSFPAFCAGRLFSSGDTRLALELTVATLATIWLASAIAVGDERRDRIHR